MARVRVVRVAVIGLGAAARGIVLPALASLSGVQLVGGADPDARAVDLARRRWRLPLVDGDPARLLARSRPEVVAIAAPPATHRELALLALNCGCHVFCEKPFVGDLAEADEVIAAADRTGRRVAVNNQYRQMAIYRAAREAAVAAGGPFFASVTQSLYLPPGDEPGWRGQLRERVLFEFGTHPLDLLSYYFDAYPESVAARTPRVPRGGEADALTVLRLDFPGERVATLTLNRVSRAAPRYLDLHLDCPEAALDVSLGGAVGLELAWSRARRRPTLRVSLHRGGEARLSAGGHTRVLAREWRPPFAPATARHFAAFIAAIDRGAEPPGSACHARELLRIVAAAYASARAGGELVRL